jgi:hypothetical protein
MNYTPKTTKEDLYEMLKSTTAHLFENIRPEASLPEFHIPSQKGVQTLTQIKSGFNPVFEYGGGGNHTPALMNHGNEHGLDITRETVFEEAREIEEY